ncbi:MAG: TIGR00730 family Rossman fold protein [Gammaproteobacteria bacterium]|nr:TIGR00730 family Rossman fold protein [Gammaproteobacteria bacterium]
MTDNPQDAKPNRPGHKVPKPPDPRQRRAPLPVWVPNRGEHDPQAPSRLDRIMASASYRRADQDTEFLERKEMRGIRLQLEYEKAELILREHGVDHTIVAFGSTRITEPAEAERKRAEAEAALAANPGDEALATKLAIAERIVAKSAYYDVAREFGRIVANSNGPPANCRMLLMTGGGPGMMEAANRGAHDVGGRTVGLNIDLPHEQYPNCYLTPELALRFRYFALRKMHFMLRARAIVAFPGGFGTMDELFEALTLIQTRTIRPLPVILVGEQFWRGVINFEHFVDEGVIDAEDLDIFWFAETAREIWDGILDWHELNGSPLPTSGDSK